MWQVFSMGRERAVTHHDQMAIAVATGLSLRTVEKYYRGLPVAESTRNLLERACFELHYPTVGEKRGKRG